MPLLHTHMHTSIHTHRHTQRGTQNTHVRARTHTQTQVFACLFVVVVVVVVFGGKEEIGCKQRQGTSSGAERDGDKGRSRAERYSDKDSSGD